MWLLYEKLDPKVIWHFWPLWRAKNHEICRFPRFMLFGLDIWIPNLGSSWHTSLCTLYCRYLVTVEWIYRHSVYQQHVIFSSNCFCFKSLSLTVFKSQTVLWLIPGSQKRSPHNSRSFWETPACGLEPQWTVSSVRGLNICNAEILYCRGDVPVVAGFVFSQYGWDPGILTQTFTKSHFWTFQIEF